MAIKSNASTEEVMGSGIKLYSGITNMAIIAVTPTMADLHALDINVKSEQNYDVTIADASYQKIAFWLRNSQATVRLEILMQSEKRTSKTGKFQWINNIGQATWSDDAPAYEWWKSEGQRHAYVGEETLVSFVKAWANVASGDEVSFETIDKIVKGDTKELKDLVNLLNSNSIRVLVGVRDGKYQSVYTKHFGRIKPQRDDLFIKSLNDDYGTFNADFNADLAWGDHIPTIDLISPDAVSEDEDWAMPVTAKAATVAPF